MAAFQDIYCVDTTDYVLGLVRDLHRSEQARVTVYARQPYAAALEHIARERADALGQLVRAIECGLFDQLDAADEAEALADVQGAEHPYYTTEGGGEF